MSVATTTVAPVTLTTAERKRRVTFGLVFTLFGLAILWFFAFNSEGGQLTTFGLNPGFASNAPKIPDLVFPTQPVLYALGLVSLFFGGWQFARGFKAYALIFSVVFLLFVTAFLTWAARDGSFNLVGMLQATLVRATPIALGAFSGVMAERAAIINIAIEGMMLSAALVAVMVASASGSLWLGLLGGVLIGGILGGLHGLLSIQFKVDQIISGTAINILSTGTTSFIVKRFFIDPQINDSLNNSGIFPPIHIPLLSDVPIIGPVFFSVNILPYLMVLVLVVQHVVLFYTRWGLRTIAVGEHPEVADTLGVNVFKVRYVNVIISGMIAGLGGAYFTVGRVGQFDEVMTAGRGFIGLAAMIFGKWTPIGSVMAALLFGFADSFQQKIQILIPAFPSEFLLAAPYVITMIVLAGVIGRAIAPAADGVPYEKD
ncbi:MAG: ABC transporter permease [Anaerolineae bacterium]